MAKSPERNVLTPEMDGMKRNPTQHLIQLYHVKTVAKQELA